MERGNYLSYLINSVDKDKIKYLKEILLFTFYVNRLKFQEEHIHYLLYNNVHLCCKVV